MKPVLFSSQQQKREHAAILSGDAYKGKKKNFNLEMERMIKQQIFALEMDALTNRLQRLQLDKTVALLHELWDKMKIGGRRKVEVTTNEDGMEVIIGELMAPTFYFTNEKKFWRQLRCIIKLSLYTSPSPRDQRGSRMPSSA